MTLFVPENTLYSEEILQPQQEVMSPTEELGQKYSDKINNSRNKLEI